MKQHRFSERLVELRRAQNLSQYSLAEQLGFTRGQIANYEQGTREPDYATLIKLADFFAVSVDHLLGRVTPTSVKDYKEQGTKPVIESEYAQLVHELVQRHDLQALLEEARHLSHESVQRVIRYIRLVEKTNDQK
ncbi:MAG TPA: helix-turn-helix transcriptional regulator [Corynebacteriales bacterium]|nr:helix-turn-helix transcriptional regulator [Mycobacteriales bacterium]